MQPKPYFRSFFSLALLVLVLGSCSRKLEEHPYTVFSTNYYQSVQGLQGGIAALYSDMRYDYGPEGTNGLTCDGTDEWTYADQVRTGAGGTGDYLTLGNYTLDAGNGAILTPWNNNFSAINLANGLIQFAPGVSMDSTYRNEIIALARFFRGLNYMLLVEQFGAVPVDLGSGPLKFNQTSFQGFNRLPIDSVFMADFQTMIDDFTYASTHLPMQLSPVDSVTQPAAYLMLARTYIFRAYSKYKQGGDFAAAYQAAMQVINNQSQYDVALLQDFARVNAEGNDYNSETLYSVNRIPGDLNDNEATSGQIGGGKEVDAANDFTPAYTLVTAPTASSTTAPCATRISLYGRPIRRFCPTAWLFNVAFADKFNDARYNGSFRTVWKATVAVGGFAVGDTAFVLANTNAIADSMNAIPKSYRVIAPREMYVIGGGYSLDMYPSLSKFEDSSKVSPNDPGGRPYKVAKLSELYLLAAEAAFQGGSSGGATDAANLINVLRVRAAYRPGLAPSDLAARQQAMVVTPGQVTLDFIMDERTRELCGESMRWPDLAMRGLLVSRVQADNPDAAANIQSYHTLRPIPQSQLDAVNSQNSLFQNPGY